MATCWLVDVFADGPRAGNPAGVVLHADDLSEAEMQRLATALAVSDTAFVTGRRGARRIRWFTPAREIDLCGHATIAAAQVLDEGPVTFTYAGGELALRAEALGGDLVWWLGRPAPELTPSETPLDDVLAALGAPALDPELPALLSPEHDLLLPLHNTAAVERLRPDMDALASAADAAGLRGVAAFANPGPGHFELRVRFFAPSYGVPEDPATGSVHGPLAVYLHGCDLVPHFPDELRALSLQGAPDGRQGVLWLRLTIDEPSHLPVLAEVGGLARVVQRQEL